MGWLRTCMINCPFKDPYSIVFFTHCRKLISFFELAFLQCKILLFWIFMSHCKKHTSWHKLRSLLQLQPGETEPRPVAFMSRKLSGAQYRYDARNMEALAAQMALTTWRTIVLGVQFEIYSDHDSLKYLFTQKAPSQRILRLCEFLADYDFTEIKYVPCPVPSRLWLYRN